MIKYYCDCCHAEIPEANACTGGFPHDSRLGGTIEGPGEAPARSVTVLTATDGDWDHGDYCRYCVIDMVKSLDDRPQG